MKILLLISSFTFCLVSAQSASAEVTKTYAPKQTSGTGGTGAVVDRERVFQQITTHFEFRPTSYIDGKCLENNGAGVFFEETVRNRAGNTFNAVSWQCSFTAVTEAELAEAGLPYGSFIFPYQNYNLIKNMAGYPKLPASVSFGASGASDSVRVSDALDLNVTASISCNTNYNTSDVYISNCSKRFIKENLLPVFTRFWLPLVREGNYSIVF